ncbi:MAG TPA: amidohydrolase family protein [Candidatus Kryptonia bacterium]|nr:amidohydrolase family protein [Candidatus Kryptonia bacterium]
MIVIDKTRIAAVGPQASTTIPTGAEVIDAAGKFVIPGLADMHNHLRSGASNAWENPRPILGQLLGWGITLTLMPGMETEAVVWLKTNVAGGDTTPYPHFFGTGPMFVPPQMHGVDYSPGSADEARTLVQQLKAAHVDAVKLVHDDMSWFATKTMSPLAPDIVAAIVDEAHKQDLKVCVHAPILKYAKESLRAGADILMHGIISDPVDDEFLALMRQNRAVYVSTLAFFESCADPEGWVEREMAFDERRLNRQERYEAARSPEWISRLRASRDRSQDVKDHLPVLRENLMRVFRAGIPVVAGTDTGLGGVIVGVASQLELQLLAQAGLTPKDVLAAATINAATMVGAQKNLGTVEVGKLADMVILDADPLADISNVRHVSRVIKGGLVYDPDEVVRRYHAQENPQ